MNGAAAEAATHAQRADDSTQADEARHRQRMRLLARNLALPDSVVTWWLQSEVRR
jgi:hypothetical protein